MEQQSSQPESNVASKEEENIEKNNRTGIEEANTRTRKSRLMRIGFLLLFVIISTLPVVRGCGMYTVSSSDVMTFQLSEKMSENTELTPFIIVGVLTLWSTVILLAVSLFPMKERDSSRLTIGAAVSLSGYLLTVLAYANKDAQTSNVISLEYGWYLLLVVTGVLYAHKYLFRRMLGGEPIGTGSAEELPIKSNPETISSTRESTPVVTNTTEQEVSSEVHEPIMDDEKEAITPENRDAESEEEENENVLKPKRKKWKIVLGIIGGIVVMVVAVVGILVYLEYSHRQDAIELTKSDEYQGITWGDRARNEIESNPTVDYRWVADNYGEDGVYFVQFIDADGWGKQWETDINENTVKLITGDEYLSRKYGITSVHSGEYKVSIGDMDDFSVVLNSDSDGGATVRYSLNGSIQNLSGKHVSDVEVEYRILIVHENETIKDALRSEYILDRYVSRRSPWMPDESVPFSFRTKGIDAAYFRTEPAYFLCQIWVHAEDMSGYEYHHCVGEVDFMERWKQVAVKVKDKIEAKERFLQSVGGTYVRNPEQGDATLRISQPRNGMVSVEGEAYYDDGRGYGPNTGTLEFEASMEGEIVQYRQYYDYGDPYNIEIRFIEGGLQVTESGSNGAFGWNVDFAGSYKKQ